MIRFAKFAVMSALLASCAAPPAQVSKGAPVAFGVGASLPAMQVFAGSGGTAPQRSNTEIAADFLDLEFRMESGRTLPVLTRFDGPILVAMTGDVPGSAVPDLTRLITRLRAEAGVDVRLAGAGQTPSIRIDFHPRATLQRLVPSAACFVVPRVASLAEYRARRNSADVDWANLTERTQVSIFVPSDTSPQEVRDCLHEELAQAMGPLNDLYRLSDSVYNDDNFHTVLTGFDMLILRAHYAPELRSGMTRAEVARVLPSVLARLNPAGQFGGSTPGALSPRPWIDAVSAALGPRGTPAGRAAAADRMLSIAMAQGWRDNRLAFSYFAIGRLNVARDPEVAVRAFSTAARIYRTQPGSAIHVAHVDMQLAAIALSQGQPGQAIAFADRAIPAVRQAQNAALLATLMLIKSAAMEATGRVTEARALRLDSLGWARYGFGAEQQVRSRMSEIASLAARGNRS